MNTRSNMNSGEKVWPWLMDLTLLLPSGDGKDGEWGQGQGDKAEQMSGMTSVASRRQAQPP